MKPKELLLAYISPCLNSKYPELKKLPKYKIFESLNTNNQIRNYFFTNHNQKEINQNNLIHLVIPYKIIGISNNEIKTQLAIEPIIKIPESQLIKKFSKEKIPHAKLEDIIITHFLKPVDYLSKQEFKKYETSFIL